MIIEYVLLMRARLFIAGYRPKVPLRLTKVSKYDTIKSYFEERGLNWNDSITKMGLHDGRIDRQ